MNRALTSVKFVLVWLACAIVSPLQAVEQAKTYVVLVGVSKYQDEQIQPRAFAEADAKALYDLFTNKDYLGLPKNQIKLLLGRPVGPAEEATHDRILDAVNWLVTSAGEEDVAVFGFFGAGEAIGQRACYLAVDSKYKDRERTAIAASDFESAFKKLKARRLCVLLDVNFKAYQGPDRSGDLDIGKLYQEFLEKRSYDDYTARVVFLANKGVSAARDLNGHGLFARVLIDALSGKADHAGGEADGVITAVEIKEYLEKEVPARSRATGKVQTSITLGRPTSFILSRNPQVVPLVEKQLATIDRLVANKLLSPERGAEAKRLLAQMPKLKYQRDLRRTYQDLVAGRITARQLEQKREAILNTQKIPPSVARNFADKVLEATEEIVSNYLKELDQGQMIEWAIRGLYERIDERVPEDIETYLKHCKDYDKNDLRNLLIFVRRTLGNRDDLDNHKDIDYALQRMTAHLDPYTTYIDPETMAQFLRDIRRNYTGVGIQIRKDPELDMLRVVTPIKGSPAHKAGIQTGDIITTIKRWVDSDGQPLPEPEIISTKGLSISEAVKKVLGKANTKVTLTIQREGHDKPFDVEITRASIELETVSGFRRKADDSWDFMIDPENKIGYIRLSGFADKSALELRRAVERLRAQGMKGLVLDLRFNPGGLLRSAVAICDMFINDGEIVSIRPRVGRSEVHRGRRPGSLLDFPMAVLINGYSASASEIVSACLQDHGRAIVVGERSFGKGSVQNIHPFDGGQLKLTIASFWRPSGKNLNKSSTDGSEDEDWGVIPDIVVKLSNRERDQLTEHLQDIEVIPRRDVLPKPKPKFTDRQLEVALKHLRGRIHTAQK
ncbi:MAG: hypothetical protein KatS3mg105_2161 [Gemmatales bacterium]|nr:MAG: hypothetical protein KatS3mg105_2161 [Gemmatales bacterium]